MSSVELFSSNFTWPHYLDLSQGNGALFENQILLPVLCRGTSMEEIKKLIEARPGILEEYDDNENSPIHIVLQKNLDVNILKLLVAYKVNVENFNIFGETPLMWAIANCEDERIAILIEATTEVGINLKDFRGDVPLSLLLGHFKSEKLIYQLLDKYPDLNTQNNLNETPLMIAAKTGQSKAVMFRMLDQDSDLGLRNLEGDNLLAVALFKGLNDTIIFEILKRCSKEEINARNTLGATPLMKAIGQSSKLIIQKLLEYGADATLIDKEGKTCQVYASEYKREDEIKNLVCS